jgi:hypothetical protein
MTSQPRKPGSDDVARMLAEGHSVEQIRDYLDLVENCQAVREHCCQGEVESPVAGHTTVLGWIRAALASIWPGCCGRSRA